MSKVIKQKHWDLTYEERIKNTLSKPLTREDLQNLFKKRLYDMGTPIDSECIELCVALNSLPGITTIDSCCGHDIEPFKIYFISQSMESLIILMEILSHHGSHNNPTKWRVYNEVEYWEHKRKLHPATFTLEGPTGEYNQANELVTLIEKLEKDREKEEKESLPDEEK